jgi:hypothetical protein
MYTPGVSYAEKLTECTSVVLKVVGTAPLGAVRGTQWAVTVFWAAGGRLRCV